MRDLEFIAKAAHLEALTSLVQPLGTNFLVSLQSKDVEAPFVVQPS